MNAILSLGRRSFDPDGHGLRVTTNQEIGHSFRDHDSGHVVHGQRKQPQALTFSVDSPVDLDPFGIVWWIATRIEDVSPEEMDRRFAAGLASR